MAGCFFTMIDYIHNDWKRRNNFQKSSLVGLGLVFVYIFIISPLYLIIAQWGGNILFNSCQDNMLMCYILGVLGGAIWGLPVSAGIMVISFLAGWILDKKVARKIEQLK